MPTSPFSPIVGRTQAGLLFNDGIHWLAYHHDLRKGVIAVFDLMERKLFYMDLPYNSYWCCELWVFGEFLSFSTMNFSNNTVMIWTMKEYKVNSSWTKTHAVSVDGTPNESFSPFCCTKNGDIIGTDQETGLVRYNDKGQLLEHRPYSSEFEAVVYTEFLLSLPGESEQA
uniref:F-box associated interaction domain-containing protein n=1 Tax=Medicago truncatula TaxID=3880 RepID=I3SHK8_MEDTR|nr:unknown [Medicago truncatula]